MLPLPRLALALAACATLLPAASAAAKRAPTTSERTAIAQAFRDFNASSPFGAVRDSTVEKIVVSTKGAGWARLDASAKGLDDSFSLLSKTNGSWHLLNLGTAQVSCGVHAPAAVRQDLFPGERCPPPRQSFRGTTSAGALTFGVSPDGRFIVNLRFVNRCPADSVRGTLVGARIPLRKGDGAYRTFSYRDEQFTIEGRFTSANVVTGTVRDRTGDCDSGTLAFRAAKVLPGGTVLG